MNKKVYIKQDGTIPGNRIIEELERRGGINSRDLQCCSGSQFGPYYAINNKNEIDLLMEPLSLPEPYTELLYNIIDGSFYEHVDIREGQEYICYKPFVNCIAGRKYLSPSDGNIVDDFGTQYNLGEKAGMFLRPVGASGEDNTLVPEGWGDSIDEIYLTANGKERRTDGEKDYYYCDFDPITFNFFVDIKSSCSSNSIILEGLGENGNKNFFKTALEAQAFCDKLNDSLKHTLEERKSHE